MKKTKNILLTSASILAILAGGIENVMANGGLN